MNEGRIALREWLSRSLLRRKDLADRLDISRPYMSQVLGGARRPRLELLTRIENVTGVPTVSWVDTRVSSTPFPRKRTAKSTNVCRVLTESAPT